MNFPHSQKAEKNCFMSLSGRQSFSPSVSLVHSVFSYAYYFQVPVTKAMLELAMSHGSLIYGVAVTKRDRTYGSLSEKTKSALVTIGEKGSCTSSEAT